MDKATGFCNVILRDAWGLGEFAGAHTYFDFFKLNTLMLLSTDLLLCM